MKKILFALMLVVSTSASAGQITLTNSGEHVSGDTKYCYYENSQYSFSYEVSASRECPYTRTFQVDN